MFSCVDGRLSFNIIGAGRLGMTLARLAHLSGAYRIGGIYNRSPESSEAAAAFIGAGDAVDHLAKLPSAKLYLLAVPDDSLVDMACRLANSGVLRDKDIVFHASGSAEPTILAPISACGALKASLHPVFSFAQPQRAVSCFAGTYCAVQGEDDALHCLKRLVRHIGGQPFCLPHGSKAAYHVALTLASNYLVTLASLAQQVIASVDIHEVDSHVLIQQLMQQTLANIAAVGTQAALTGPIARGDVHTVGRHLRALDQGIVADCYRELGLATLALAANRLDGAQLAALQDCLANPSFG